MSEFDEGKAARRDRYGRIIEGGGSGTPGRATPTSRMAPSARAIARAVLAEMQGIAPGADALVARAADGGGQPLPVDLRGRFEASLGADLGGVRVHTDTAAADASRALGARAYATGQDVFMGAGQYAPQTAEGAHLLAHEVAHTVQQGAGSTLRPKLEVSQPDAPLEVEADHLADAMVAGRSASTITQAPSDTVHRDVTPAASAASAPAAAEAGDPRLECNNLLFGGNGYFAQQASAIHHLESTLGEAHPQTRDEMIVAAAQWALKKGAEALAGSLAGQIAGVMSGALLPYAEHLKHLLQAGFDLAVVQGMERLHGHSTSKAKFIIAQLEAIRVTSEQANHDFSALRPADLTAANGRRDLDALASVLRAENATAFHEQFAASLGQWEELEFQADESRLTPHTGFESQSHQLGVVAEIPAEEFAGIRLLSCSTEGMPPSVRDSMAEAPPSVTVRSWGGRINLELHCGPRFPTPDNRFGGIALITKGPQGNVWYRTGSELFGPGSLDSFLGNYASLRGIVDAPTHIIERVLGARALRDLFS